MLREAGDGVICIGQASHAWLSGQLAGAWGNDAFPRVERWEEVVLAALQHDIGMAEWDLTPGLNLVTGWPLSFMELPIEQHLSLWSAAPGKVLTQNRYAALLVSMHGTALYEKRDPRSLSRGDRRLADRYLSSQRALQDSLLAALGMEREAAMAARRLLAGWDRLSLMLCVPWEGQALEAIPGRNGPVEVSVRRDDEWHWRAAPWPFAGERVAVQCEGRRLEKRFGSERALHDALARAPVETLRFTLSPG